MNRIGWTVLNVICIGQAEFFNWIQTLPAWFWSKDGAEMPWQTILFHCFEDGTPLDIIAHKLGWVESRREAQRMGYVGQIGLGLGEEKNKGKKYHEMRRWITWKQINSFN